MENDRLIMNKLDNLTIEISQLREHILDITLTSDDLTSIKEAENDLKTGKTKRL